MNISVIIPCHNAERYIGQTIGSVLQQTKAPSEVIVVDDGSEDSSAEIAGQFGSPVKVISRRCGGASRARNFGYRFSTGDAIMFLDADDVLGPRVLEGLSTAIRDADIALCHWDHLRRENGIWVSKPPSCKSLRADRDYLANWLTGWWHPPCSVIWSRQAFERTGGWDQRAFVNDDGELITRALAKGAELTFSAKGTSYYRVSVDDEMSVSDKRFSRKGLQSRIYAARKLAKLLEQENKLSQYHPPLRTKFEEIAADCDKDTSDLQELCYHYANEYSNSHRQMWLSREQLKSVRRSVRPAIRRVIPARIRARIRRLPLRRGKAKSDQAKRNQYGREIRYGLKALAEVEEQPIPSASEKIEEYSESDPEVTVIIPTYNRGALIGRAIDSALSQTFRDLEIIIIDDGSTDDTEEVISEYDDGRIRYIRQSENKGVAAARNRGMIEARGKYIAFLDSDDEWFPTKIAKQVRCFRSASDRVGLVYCGVETIESDKEKWIYTPEYRGSVYENLLLDNIIHSGSGTMIRREVIRTVGLFNDEIPAHEDYDYWLRISRFYEFDYVNEPLIRYYNVEGIGRKTLDTRANVKARHWFYKKYRHQMQAADVDYLFLVETARWHLVWDHDRMRALLVLLWALAKSPLRTEGYHLLPRIVLPTRVYHLLRKHLISA